MLTCSDLEVLLHYHVATVEHPRIDAPAVKRAINKFLTDGIFQRIDGDISTTARGTAFIKMLKETPYPEDNN